MRIISGTRQVVKIFLGLRFFSSKFVGFSPSTRSQHDPQENNNNNNNNNKCAAAADRIGLDRVYFVPTCRIRERESRNRNKYLPYSNTFVHSVTYIDNQISNIPLTQTKIFDSIDRYHHNPQPTLYISLKFSNILHHVNNIFRNGTY